MWYTVLYEGAPIGVVELSSGRLTAGAMHLFPTYTAIRQTVRAATAALLRLGLFGAAYPPVPPHQIEIIRLRRSIARGGATAAGTPGRPWRPRTINLCECSRGTGG